MSRRTVLACLLVASPSWLPAQDTAESLAAQVDGIMAGWSRPDSPGCAVGVLKLVRVPGPPR